MADTRTAFVDVGEFESSRVIAEDTKGGFLRASVAPVHSHSCGEWRLGKSHKPCSCGASELYARWLTTSQPKETP